MGKKLVIVESPAKARTINKILGKDFLVKASMGHVRDLPEKQLGVDIEKNFTPQYKVIKDKQKVIKELQNAAKDVETVYLAPDPDREGEAIAWHLQAALEKQVPAENFLRVTYNEITAPAIREAFAHPRQIDQNRVNSQQARRILDRIVGYKVSPLLWSRVRGGASAGRVQSVALRLVCEREKEIRNFVKEKFWVLGAKLRKLVDPRDVFETRLVKIGNEKADLRDEAQAERIFEDVQNSAFRVQSIKDKETQKRARPPYITSSLQQAGSSVHGFSPSRTMMIAQKLYEGVDLGEGRIGLITYMRTDSFNVSKVAQDQARDFIRKNFGDDYVPEKPNFYKSRGTAQEAHEAIRPTDPSRTPESVQSALSPEEAKLYALIWKRFMASQMTPARIAQRSVEIEALPKREGADPLLFRANASQVLFPGYMKASGLEKTKTQNEGEEEEDDTQGSLPPLTEGEGLECVEPVRAEKETQP
ncbi:MAG TPA: type I DNA topoisomerase, partial [Kiritimatiellia bacterium]|nr:type I DNA topoisomerase [Kiritimatiellia bacterium]